MSTLTPGIYDATPVEFPNLFTETVRPTIASIMVFAFADLRRIAREETEHGSNDSLKVLDLPMSGRDMIKVCLENLELIKQKVRPSHYKIVNYLLSNDFMEAHGKEVSSIDHVLIHYCGDDNELNECVHSIAANSKTKQITLSFRGSITMQDWLHDAELVIGDVANPLYDKDDKSKDQPEYLGVHLGFRDYLYDVKDPLLRTIRLNEMQSKMNRFLAGNKDSSSAKREPEKSCNDDNKETTQQVPAHVNEGQKGSHQPLHKIQSKVTEEIIKVNEEITKLKVKMVSKEVSQEMEPPKNKIDIILDQVQVLLDANPGYKLYITGHSLGGALALLTSVQASVRFARPGIPVTCVTVANPRVGDTRFRGAIQSLEQNKMLRLLTVHNSLDLVPSMPNRLCRCDFCRPNKFCMPGIIMILKKRSFSITYHSDTNDTRWEELKGEFQRLVIVIFCFYQMGLSHDYRTYLDRLVAEKDKLTKMYLNDLYREQGGIDFDK
jgi:hypothetical protein